MKSIPELVIFAQARTETESFLPDPEKRISGDPEQTVRNHFSDASGQFHAGEWTGEVGEWKVSYTEQEFCFITKGEVIITSEDGQQWQLGAGAAFVIPSGFKGTWKILKPVHKHYVIYEQA